MTINGHRSILESRLKRLISGNIFNLAFYSCIGRGVDQQVQYLKSVKLKLTEMIIKNKNSTETEALGSNF